MTSGKSHKQVGSIGAVLGLLAVPLLVLALAAQPGRAFPVQSATTASSPASPEEEGAGGEQSPRTIPRIVLGAQTATPGVNVVIALYYTPAQGVELRSLVVEVEWVSKHLQFVRSQRGIAAEMIGANVDTKVTGTRTDSESLERTTLRIDASVVEENPKRGLPEGLLAYLTFRVSSDAQPFAIELRPTLVSALDISSPARKIAEAEMENGKVSVELPGLPPYVTCFFFTH